jgi:putative nucleotidyltransferase with HDIG domain
LLARLLVSSLAQAVQEWDTEAIVASVHLLRKAHPQAEISTVLEAVCNKLLAIAANVDGVDLGQVMVFLEIVQGRVLSGPGEVTSEIGEQPSVRALLLMLRGRDDATCVHSYATSVWARRLATALGLGDADVETIATAAVLHDIGKVATPDGILLKPGPLTAEEWAVMQQHATFGAEIVSEIPSLARYAPIVRVHHERPDGHGYPDGLRGDDIPLSARVVAVADAFHAMISKRPYREAMSFSAALETLRAGRGAQWDASVVDAMCVLVGRHRAEVRSRDLAQFDERVTEEKSVRTDLTG